jgi:hypothetical protein
MPRSIYGRSIIKRLIIQMAAAISKTARGS